MGAKTSGAGVDGSSVEVGPGEIDVGSPIVVTEEPGLELCAAHHAIRKVALTRAKFKAVCLLIGTISPLLFCRPGCVGEHARAGLSRTRECRWGKHQGVGLALGSAASPWVGVALWLGVGFGLRRVSTSDRLTPIACVGVAIVPRMLRIGRLLRNLLGVQRFTVIPSQ